MPRFFIESGQVAEGVAALYGQDAHHISRSLRMAKGEEIILCDENKTEYLCRLSDFLPDCVCAEVLSVRESTAEPPYSATLYQALPKGEKLDMIIQKAVESGVSAITTFESERCIVRIKDAASEEKKTERRRRIAAEAAKQCGRALQVPVNPTVSYTKALADAKEADIPLFCYEGEGTLPLSAVLKQKKAELQAVGKEDPTVSIMVGSEGGFSEAEAKAAIAAGMIPVCLGKRILRTETAASFVLACLVYEFEL